MAAERLVRESLDRGEKYLKDHKTNEAIIDFRKALQVDPDFAPALRALALLIRDVKESSQGAAHAAYLSRRNGKGISSSPGVSPEAVPSAHGAER